MSGVRTWLVSDKQFSKYYRAFTRRNVNRCRTYLYSAALNPLNFSSHLSFLFQNQPKRNATAPSALRVPPTGGTLSFDGARNIWFFEMEKVPARYRAGLAKLLDKYRSRLYFCSVFSPRTFSFGLAEKSDFYFIKKRGWQPVAKQIGSVFARLDQRQAIMPELDLPPRFTLQDKLVLRIFWRFRKGFLSLNDLSSYAYGRRLPHNLHASEVALCKLRRRIKRLTGVDGAIERVRNYGYQIGDRVWDELLK